MNAIADGYSRRIRLSGETFIYRPATRAERDEFRHWCKFVTPDHGQRLMLEWASRHVVESSIHAWQAKDDVFEQLLLAIQGLIPDASGKVWAEIEGEWKANLIQGVLFERDHPMYARRSCDNCRKFFYNEKTGAVIRDARNTPVERIGGTMCESDMEPHCPKGHWKNPKSLNSANRWALNHFRECEATGHFPDDAIVRANALAIRNALASKPRRAA